MQGKPYYDPTEGSLPGFRVKDVPPFTIIGIDFAGPLFYKDNDSEMKECYIVLYTFCTSRALHLDLVTDLSGPVFLRSLHAFSVRRRTPSLIKSDNAETLIVELGVEAILNPRPFSYIYDEIGYVPLTPNRCYTVEGYLC